MKRGLKVGIIAGCLLVWFHSSGLALTNEEVFAQFQFNFITPGARATGLGGAFIGLADDATAVESNPAGLTKLVAPEISAEFKHITYTSEQFYENNNPQATSIEKKEFDDSVASVPFLSVVYPYKGGKRKFVFSAYRQELLNYKSSFKTSADPIDIPGTYDASDGTWRSFFPVEASTELTVTNYGVGVAAEFFDGHLSLAASPRWSIMEMKSHSARFGYYSFPGPTDFSDADVENETRIDDEDSGFSVNAGLKWDPDPRVSFGLVYRSGLEFNVTEKPGRRGFSLLDPLDEDYDSDFANFTLNIPDSFGAGVSFRALETDNHILQFAVDVVHIRYKDILEGFDTFFGNDPNEYNVDNITELHVGVEYTLMFEDAFIQALFLRAGVYNEPDHTIRYTGSDIDEKQRFPGGDDQTHITGGVGVAINNHLQIDTAANIADNNTQISISAVYRF